MAKITRDAMQRSAGVSRKKGEGAKVSCEKRVVREDKSRRKRRNKVEGNKQKAGDGC